jgi:hypothetical protein
LIEKGRFIMSVVIEIKQLKESFKSFNSVKVLNQEDAKNLEERMMSLPTNVLLRLVYCVGKIPFVNKFAASELELRGEI